MGFCRRCGDIVVGPRCKCGGSAVAPVVKWPDEQDGTTEDRWSKTYVTKAEKSPERPAETSRATHSGPSTPCTRRTTRPAVSTSTAISSRVSAHIASATASRPSSPLKQSTSFRPDDVKAKEGILPSPHGSELAKVYGSVLQPKETLASFACATCSTPFPPDATIYPDPCPADPDLDPSAPIGTRFLCRPCFVKHGGSKGDCPNCHRPVLILKSEGGFVESAGQVWHKKCFVCDSCGKNIGDHPMVDLLSRPCCTECFDTCLKRPVHDSFREASRADVRTNAGNKRRDSQSREQSPTLGELERRLGIAPRRVSVQSLQSESEAKKVYPVTPRYSNASLSDSGQDSSPGLRATPERVRPSLSPSRSSSASEGRYKSPEPDSSTDYGSPRPRRQSQTRFRAVDTDDESRSVRRTYRSGRDSLTGSPAVEGKGAVRAQPTEEAIEEMKRRFLAGSPATTPTRPPAASSNSSTPRKRSKSRSKSRPRTSDPPAPSASHEESSKKSRSLRTSASTTSLRSALRSQRSSTKEPAEAFPIYPDRTGESTRPLRIVRRDRTGESQSPLTEDLTGGTTFLERTSLGDAVRPQRTGEIAYGVDAVNVHSTGITVQAHRTGDTDYTMLASHVTGDTSYNQPISRQRTGSGIGSQNTGYALFPPLRPQKTGDKPKSSHRSSRDALGDVRTNRTGDAEVASLLGSDDLIDLHGRIPISGSRSSGSMSKIPLLGGDRRSSTTKASPLGASEGYESSVSSTPELAGDFSDAMSALSSGPTTPPSVSPPLRSEKSSGKAWGTRTHRSNTTPTPSSRVSPSGITIPDGVPSDARCEKCKELLFSIKHGGKFVTVPEEPTSTGAAPRRYHTACFTCIVCQEVFEEKEGGHAVFVRVEEGACHVRCAPPEKITLRKTPVTVVPKLSKLPVPRDTTGTVKPQTDTAYYASSSRYERPLHTAPATTSSASAATQPRFGGSTACPGCNKAVSPMERGVVPGPQGARWHSTCLICGGESAKRRRKEGGKAGCGKKLDSAAKVDAEGGVWCRECLLLLPPELRQVRSAIAPTSTGSRPTSMVTSQLTGTTLARQFTGLGLGGDPAVHRQATGGGLSPVKQTTMKLYDGPRPGRVYPRPKSVTGTRSTDGEGRGMFLIRQLTGGNTSFSGNEYGL